MKKLLSIMLLVSVTAFHAFANWHKMVNAGAVIPYASTTVEMEDFYGYDNVVLTGSGSGLGLDLHGRSVSDYGLAFLAGLNIGTVRLEKDKFADVDFLFGIGRSFSFTENLSFILSGITGLNILYCSQQADIGKIKATTSLAMANFLIGADMFLCMKVSGHMGFYAELAVIGGAGAASARFDYDINGYSRSVTDDGTTELFYLAPKVGLSFMF